MLVLLCLFVVAARCFVICCGFSLVGWQLAVLLVVVAAVGWSFAGVAFGSCCLLGCWLFCCCCFGFCVVVSFL